jgi:hypothetical protein
MLARKEAEQEMKSLKSILLEEGPARQYSEDFDMACDAKKLFENLRKYLPELEAPDGPIAPNVPVPAPAANGAAAVVSAPAPAATDETEENADGPSEVTHVILCLVVFLLLVGFGFLLLSYPQLLQSFVGSLVQMLKTPLPLYWKKAQEPPYVEYGPPYIPQEPKVTTVAETTLSSLTKVGIATGATVFGAAGVAFWIFFEGSRDALIPVAAAGALVVTGALNPSP